MIKAEWTNADALNLQPTCNQLATDCISRQAAIDALDTGLWGVKWDKALATAMLKDLPPAERKGNWIDIKCGSVSIWKCSECEEIFSEDYHYCPNCGAKMGAEE